MKKTAMVKDMRKEALAVPDLTTAFLDAQDVREISKIAYKKGLDRFLSWLSSNGITQPDRETILRFKISLRESGLSVNTVNSYLVAVKRFFTYLEGIKKYPNVAKDIKSVKRPRGHLREALSGTQIKELLAKIDTSTLPGKRDFAMINLLARTGIRTIALTRANVGDIRQSGETALLYVQRKGRDSRDDFVVLRDETLNPILVYIEARGKTDPKDPLFISHSDRNTGQGLVTRSVRRVVKENLRGVNIDSDKLTAHSLRHFFATESLRNGASIFQVQKAMGHATTQPTQRYVHNINRISDGAEQYVNI